MLKRALQDELNSFFREALAGNECTVTKSAFSQARKKFKHTAFIELNREQVNHFYTHFEPQHWQGFRLLAIDGSLATLPQNSIVGTHFGYWHPQSGGRCAKARLSQLFDVLNRISIDACIAPKEQGESTVARTHLEHIKEKDLVLLDRGYPSFWLFSAIRARGAHFCARMKTKGWDVVKDFLTRGVSEDVVLITPSGASKKICAEMGLSVEAMTVRLIRIELDNGDTEVLATSLLDQQAYPCELFKALYARRWAVEEDYKAMKARLEIENWSGKTVESVYQDFHATIFAKNLAAILAQPAQEEVRKQSRKKKYIYKVNMTHLYATLKTSVVKLLRAADPRKVLRNLWYQMTTIIEPIRPGRSRPRNKRIKRRKYPPNYKRIP